MSIRMISLVFRFYQGRASELVTALALADHANDQGGNIWPGVASLALKTRQSERALQYCLRRMQAVGWLQLVVEAHGGRPSSTDLIGKTRGRPRTYRINPQWISSALSGEMGTGYAPNSTPLPQKSTQSSVEMGAAATAPESSKNLQKDKPPARWEELGMRLGARRTKE